jgi:CDP-glucose 4,6-dehydratase
MEGLEMNASFWKNKKVFLTGHTGFKGSWLSIWLTHMGAKVYGYSLPSKHGESIFSIINLQNKIHKSTIGDITDFVSLGEAIKECDPDIAIHMAAQPLVRKSYFDPMETFSINVMGTVNFLEAIRLFAEPSVILNVTTDKCYESMEWVWPYRENDRLGGNDPYSSSKACSELVTSSYRASFFTNDVTSVVTGRAGNVIGGGDRSEDRLIPDLMRAIEQHKIINVRSPNSIRPWQHVLDPLCGYLKLVEKMHNGFKPQLYSWNFGPKPESSREVQWLVNYFCSKFPGATWQVDSSSQLHETSVLKLDSSKSHCELDWQPTFAIEETITITVEWYLAASRGEEMFDYSLGQIESFNR